MHPTSASSASSASAPSKISSTSLSPSLSTALPTSSASAQTTLGVTFTDNNCATQATHLAAQLKLPLVDLQRQKQQEQQQKYPLLLVVTPTRLELHQTTKRTHPIYVDFLSPAMRYRLHHSGGRKQLLAKAIGIKSGIKPGAKPSVLDTTAGLGKDAFILASLGCKVRMLERSPIIGALLQDGLERLAKALRQKSSIKSREIPRETPCERSRERSCKISHEIPRVLEDLQLELSLSLTITDARNFMEKMLINFHNDTNENTAPNPLLNSDNSDSKNIFFAPLMLLPDVIYLDPMYPDATHNKSNANKTALNKEEMRIIKMLVGHDNDADKIFALALQLATKRVVVKRPKRAPYIAEKKPQISFVGSSCRYDVYITQK